MQKRKRHPFIAAGILVVIVALIVFIFAVHTFGWDWTGFIGGASKITITRTPTGTTTATELQPARTLWDWLGLLAALAVPVVVGLGAAWFTAQQGKVSDAENTDNQHENALQNYIDKMSELLLHKRLSELLLDEQVSESRDIQVVIIARARTATVLRTLDPVRRGSLIRFLSQAGILTKCIEDDLKRMDLRGANLCQVNLSEINLRETDLSGADLSRANLSGADLGGEIRGVPYFRGADLIRANLMRADLRGADLSDAKVTKEQLDAAKSLQGATMPDGSIHP